MAERIVDRTTSVTEFVQEQNITTQEPTYSTQVPSALGSARMDYRSYVSDPDDLIRHYFVNSSPQKRAHLRTKLAPLIQNYLSILKILGWSRQQDIKDAYDAGVDLLAEFEELNFHRQAYAYLKASEDNLMRGKGEKEIQRQAVIRLEESWEILVKGISCAYKVSAGDRFELVGKISLIGKRRIVKTAIIDAMVTIAEDMEDTKPVKGFLDRYTSAYESDSYVCAYVQDAIEDL